MTNNEYIKLIDRTQKWYMEQNKKDKYRLFQGEDNEINKMTPWIRFSWLQIMKIRLKKGQVLKPHQRGKIERMHEFGPIKWPQSRIRERYLRKQGKLTEAA